MSARIKNLATPDEEGTLFPSVNDAIQALDQMLNTYRNKGYNVKNLDKNDDQIEYPRWEVNDSSDWIATYVVEV